MREGGSTFRSKSFWQGHSALWGTPAFACFLRFFLKSWGRRGRCGEVLHFHSLPTEQNILVTKGAVIGCHPRNPRSFLQA